MTTMKKITSFILGTAILMSASSCALFELDNYDAPEETLRGRVTDQKTGAPVLTDQGSEGIRVRLTELSWEGNVTPQDFSCMPDGTFQNTKLFEGEYRIEVDGAFIPLVRETTDGTPLADGSQVHKIKGVTEVEFKVQPFLNVEFTELPQVSNGKITAKVKVTRGVSKEEFKELIEPMGSYKDEYTNITDIQLLVSYSSSVGYRARDEVWSNEIKYEGSAFDIIAENGDEVTIMSKGTIPSGRKVYIRAAARINYDTPVGSGTRRWNYSEPLEVWIP